jgi:hypothetical protein
MTTQSVIAETVAKRSGRPVKQPSPKKSPAPCKATTASLQCIHIGDGEADVINTWCIVEQAKLPTDGRRMTLSRRENEQVYVPDRHQHAAVVT